MHEIARFTSGGGYEWEEAGLYRDENGHLWWSAQSGCSCNCYEEPEGTGEMVELMSLAQAARLYHEAFDCFHPDRPWTDVVETFIKAGVR